MGPKEDLVSVHSNIHSYIIINLESVQIASPRKGKGKKVSFGGGG